MIVTLTASAFSLAFFWAMLSKRLPTTEQRLYDKAKMKYTDGDNTWYNCHRPCRWRLSV